MEIRGAAALVTGAASGLGAATAAALAARGALVVGLDLPAAIERAQSEPDGPQDGIRLVPGDVTSEADVQRAVDEASALGPLRIAVSCAGIATGKRLIGRDGPHDQAAFERTIAVNLFGTFQVLRLAAARIAETEPLDGRDGQRGIVVQTASVAAFDGQIGQAAYSASKGAVAAMTLPAARDLARHGIRVMTVAPGVVDTPMMAGIGTEVRDALEATVPFPARLARPDEFAQLVVAVVEHDYLNGETIRMDGALRMPPR
ncbi:NAD(P)-dependent dehydrogenase (short-subunit alcohol dehydrogenase family) [Agrococcus sp. UYP33]